MASYSRFQREDERRWTGQRQYGGERRQGGYGGGWRREGAYRRNYHTGDRQQQQQQQHQSSWRSEAHRPRDDDMRQVLRTVTESLSVLSERIQKLERGPDRHPDRPTRGRTVEAGPRHTTKSDNNDFAACVKDIYRIVQLKHHESNWEELPKSLAQRLERFAGDINPPMVDQELRSKLEQLTNSYAESICDTVRKHIDRKLLETETAASVRDNTDVDRAKEIATKQLSRRLGRRMPEQRRTQLVNDAARIVGAGRSAPCITDEDGDGFQRVVNRRKPTSPAPETPSKKRKHTITPEPVSTLNRFSTLEVEADDDTEQVCDVVVNDEDDDDDASNNSQVVRSYLAAAKTQSPKTQARESETQVRHDIITVAEVHVPASAPARPRCVSLERARTLRPSSKVMRTPGGVSLFTGEKDEWKIVPADETQVLVMGDSNLKKFTQIPRGWEVHCLPGAKLQHVNKALEDLLPRRSDKLSIVYVQAGINHRDQPTAAYRQQIEKLTRTNSQTSTHIAFVGVPTPTTLSRQQRDNIEALNEMMSSALIDQYVEPIRSQQVEIIKDDFYQIHHTAYTAKTVLSSIRKHAKMVHDLN